jgi:hypothetical protein
MCWCVFGVVLLKVKKKCEQYNNRLVLFYMTILVSEHCSRSCLSFE